MSNEYGDPRDRLTEFGVPADAVEELVNQKLQEAAQYSSLAQRVERSFPELGSPAFGAWIDSNPELKQSVARMGSADPAGALEYAALRFRQAGGGSQFPNQAPNRSGAIGVQWGTGVDQLRQDWETKGTREARDRFVKARLRQVISDDFLNA